MSIRTAWQLSWGPEIWRSLWDTRQSNHDDQLFSDEERWFEDFQPHTHVDYDKLRAYAESRYAEMRENDEIVERKAEWVFGFAVLAFGGIVAFVQQSQLSIFPFSPVLAMIGVSLFLTLKARIPGWSSGPMSIRDAIRMDEQQYLSPAWITASYHGAVIALTRVVNWKAEHIINAARSMVIAIGLFALSWFAYQPFLDDGSSPPLEQTLAGQIRVVLESPAESVVPVEKEAGPVGSATE